jgi:threonyl-tRNA synthetase
VPTGVATTATSMLQRIYGTAWTTKDDLRPVPDHAWKRLKSATTGD